MWYNTKNMKKLLQISSLLVVVLILGLTIFVSKQDEVLGAVNPLAGTTYFLSGSGINSSATSITLQSLTVPQTGKTILDAELSDTFYITLEPGNRTRQELVSCTTVVQNAGGTATISGCSRGLLPFTPYTASTTYAFSHAGGSQVIFSDPPQLFNQYFAKSNDETVTGDATFSGETIIDNLISASSTLTSTILTSIINDALFTVGLSLSSGQSIDWADEDGFISGLATPTSVQTTRAANVDYVNSVANQGAATSTVSTAGISKLSVAAADANNPIVVGDNDPRFIGGTYNSTVYPPQEEVVYATTSGIVATSTISVDSTMETFDVYFHTASSSGSAVYMVVNGIADAIYSWKAVQSSGGLALKDATTQTLGEIIECSDCQGLEVNSNLKINNPVGRFKTVYFETGWTSKTTGGGHWQNGVITIATTSPISSISFRDNNSQSQLATTTIRVYQK